MKSSNCRHGPKWLSENESVWPESAFTTNIEVPELRKIACFKTLLAPQQEFMLKYSCIKRLRRILAYCLRFHRKFHAKGFLTVQELQRANERIIWAIQSAAFSREIQDLKTGKALHAKSNLLTLHPFIDDKGLLRVGGRLQNSNLAYEQKPPLFLPKKHHIKDRSHYSSNTHRQSSSRNQLYIICCTTNVLALRWEKCNSKNRSTMYKMFSS